MSLFQIMCIFRLGVTEKKKSLKKASDVTNSVYRCMCVCLCMKPCSPCLYQTACAFVHYFLRICRFFLRNRTIPKQHTHKKNQQHCMFNNRNDEEEEQKITNTLPTARCISCLSLHLYFFSFFCFFLDLIVFFFLSLSCSVSKMHRIEADIDALTCAFEKLRSK